MEVMNTPDKKEPIGTIDVEPEWKSLVPLYSEWIESGTDEQKGIAKDALFQMAGVCDEVRQFQKGKAGKVCPVCEQKRAV